MKPFRIRLFAAFLLTRCLPSPQFWDRVHTALAWFKRVHDRPGLLSGWALIGWGLSVMLAPPDYKALAQYGPPWAWAAVPAFLGGVQVVVGVLAPSAWRRRTAALIAGVWGFVELFLLLSHVRVAMVAVIPPFIVSNSLSFFFAPKDAAEKAANDEPETLPRLPW